MRNTILGRGAFSQTPYFLGTRYNWKRINNFTLCTIAKQLVKDILLKTHQPSTSVTFNAKMYDEKLITGFSILTLLALKIAPLKVETFTTLSFIF